MEYSRILIDDHSSWIHDMSSNINYFKLSVVFFCQCLFFSTDSIHDTCTTSDMPTNLNPKWFLRKNSVSIFFWYSKLSDVFGFNLRHIIWNEKRTNRVIFGHLIQIFFCLIIWWFSNDFHFLLKSILEFWTNPT